MRRAVLAALAVLSGCISTEPRLQLPYRMEANCENRAVKQTAIESIVASTDDVARNERYPGDAALRAVVHRTGGVFAYWHDQPLKLPRTAQTLGVAGPYVTLERAVITNEVQGGCGRSGSRSACRAANASCSSAPTTCRTCASKASATSKVYPCRCARAVTRSAG